MHYFNDCGDVLNISYLAIQIEKYAKLLVKCEINTGANYRFSRRIVILLVIDSYLALTAIFYFQRSILIKHSFVFYISLNFIYCRGIGMCNILYRFKLH